MEKLTLVKNEPKYYEFIRELRTNPEVSEGFISQASISREQQLDYMALHGDKYMICLLGAIPIGFIGVVANDIRLAVLPEWQGKGVGSFMLETYPFEKGSVAKVKVENKKSLNLFVKRGYVVKYYLLEKE